MKTAVFILISLLSFNVSAQSYVVDTTFGENGITTDWRCLYSQDILFDGDSYYAIGTTTICKINYNGNLNTFFGENGYAVLPSEYTVRTAMSAGDFIYLAGYTNASPTSLDIFIAKFNRSTGQLETSFGTNGIKTLDFGGLESPTGMVFNASDESIYILATKTIEETDSKSVVVSKIFTNGITDTGFDAAGYKSFSYESYDCSTGNIFLYNGGLLVTFSLQFTPSDGSNFCLLKLNPDGTTDAGFGVNGLKVVPEIFGNPSGSSIFQCIMTANNKIYAGIALGGALNTSTQKLFKYDLDSEVLTIADTNLPKYGSHLAVASDGKVYVTGDDIQYVQGGISKLRRYNGDLTIDNSFNTVGYFSPKLSATPFGNGYATTALVHDDGKIMVTGYHSVNTCGPGFTRITQGTLATSGFERNMFSVSPNPVSDHLKIKNENNVVINTIEINDISGKHIFSQKSGFSSIDVSNLQAGVYFVKVKSSEKTSILKFLKK